MDQKKLIALEGLEGAGKTTVIEVIKDFFAKELTTEKVIFTREPGGTFLAEKIRKLIVNKYQEEELCAESELLLMYASRLQHVKNLIEPALKKDIWVVSDRFNWSSFAYQAGGRDLSFNQVKSINDVFLADFFPGLILYLDLDPEIGLKRITNRSNLDRIEEEHIDFFTRARDIYLHLAKNNANAFIIDASVTKKEVQNQVLEVLRSKLL